MILIPGLTSGREVWRATAGALPGYRYHLIQVSGFAGEAARGNRARAGRRPARRRARPLYRRPAPRPPGDHRPFDGRHAGDDGRRAPSRAGRRLMVVDMYPQPAGLFGGTAQSFSPFANIMALAEAGAGSSPI